MLNLNNVPQDQNPNQELLGSTKVEIPLSANHRFSLWHSAALSVYQAYQSVFAEPTYSFSLTPEYVTTKVCLILPLTIASAIPGSHALSWRLEAAAALRPVVFVEDSNESFFRGYAE